jgi:hypothetical protein
MANLFQTVPQELIDNISINLNHNDIIILTETLELPVDYSQLSLVKYPAFYFIINTCKQNDRYYRNNFTWESAYLLMESLNDYLCNKINNYKIEWNEINDDNVMWNEDDPQCIKNLETDIDNLKKSINYKDPNKFFDFWEIKNMHEYAMMIDLINPQLQDIQGLYLLITKYKNSEIFLYKKYFPNLPLINHYLFQICQDQIIINNNADLKNIVQSRFNSYTNSCGHLCRAFIYIIKFKKFDIDTKNMVSKVSYHHSEDLIYRSLHQHILDYIQDHIN